LNVYTGLVLIKQCVQSHFQKILLHKHASIVRGKCGEVVITCMYPGFETALHSMQGN